MQEENNSSIDTQPPTTRQGSQQNVAPARRKIINCKNCFLNYRGNYCPRCGQGALTRRFNMRYFFSESIFSSLDIEKGLFFTIKQLTIQPGKVLQEYIQGQRVNLYIPIRFLVLIGTIATFISLRYKLFLIQEDTEMPMNSLDGILPAHILNWYNVSFQGFWHLANEYTTLINIIAIPVFSFCSYLVFIRQGYNYAENLILNMYIVCMQLFLLIVFTIPFEIFPAYQESIIGIYTFITIGYNIWCYLCFFDQKTIKGLGLPVLANVLGYMLQFIVVHILYYIAKQVTSL